MKKVRIILAILLATGIMVGLAAAVVGFRYAYVPSQSNVISMVRPMPYAYDLWGQMITAKEAQKLRGTEEGKRKLSAHDGAVPLDDAMWKLGRTAFYGETFGNEVFLTDVVGVIDGPLAPRAIMKAILALRGAGTSNLQVELPQDAVIGGKRFAKGDLISTGLDVPKGAFMPLGMPMTLSRGRVRAGIACAACHSSVDPETKQVVEGMPNGDFNAGLILAFATNSAAFFMHTDVDPKQYIAKSGMVIKTSSGGTQRLPDSAALENAVDAALMEWPPGNFDSFVDMQAAPTQLPVSWTLGNHPYSHSGAFAAGPFQGLSAQNNNVHGLNSDATLLTDFSQTLFGMDPELFLGTMLQNASRPRFRFDPASGKKPSEFIASVDPTPESRGINHNVPAPGHPRPTLMSPTAALATMPGRPFWKDMNAMSVFQHTLVPPKAPLEADDSMVTLGHAVFERAGCASCHSGPFLTNNRVIPVEEIRTDPTRARGLEKTEPNLAEPYLYPFDAEIPLRPGVFALRVPTVALDPAQIELAWAHKGTGGGYKVPALVGLWWTAPYLHDGGVAVGKDPLAEIGVPGTLLVDKLPDPANSLRALVDRTLRKKVIAANQSSARLSRQHISGAGHEFWVDADADFSPEEQKALIYALLLYEPTR